MTVFEKINGYHARLSPTKVARKYKLLLENPFRFFRGTNQLFYEDLKNESFPTSPICWICGDLHLENFGSYKGDNRLVYFDLNDFDEAILAPVGWELARVITSILVAFDELQITDKEAIEACNIFLKAYSKILADGNSRYIETRTAKGIVKRFLNSVEQRSDKKLLAKRTINKNGKLRLSPGNNKQLRIDKDLKKKLCIEFNKWMKSNNQPPNDYKVLDARFRLAGTGSMGIQRYVFLIQKIQNPEKYMLIDMKQATPSSLNSYVNVPQPEWESEAHRMVHIQKMMQNIAPAQLSTIEFEGQSYLMQELQPTKDRINFKMIEEFENVCSVLNDMAMITASSHLRSSGRKGGCSADELIAFGKDDHWQSEIIDYALRYKRKVFSDWRDFKTQTIKNKKENKLYKIN
ncbi:MAG: DUF2252 domain-containing protein [Bacteroidota bacterium]|nr:DUF2252 domain-containing protein [Bacteroidota bacterium]